MDTSTVSTMQSGSLRPSRAIVIKPGSGIRAPSASHSHKAEQVAVLTPWAISAPNSSAMAGLSPQPSAIYVFVREGESVGRLARNLFQYSFMVSSVIIYSQYAREQNVGYYQKLAQDADSS